MISVASFSCEKTTLVTRKIGIYLLITNIIIILFTTNRYYPTCNVWHGVPGLNGHRTLSWRTIFDNLKLKF